MENIIEQKVAQRVETIRKELLESITTQNISSPTTPQPARVVKPVGKREVTGVEWGNQGSPPASTLYNPPPEVAKLTGKNDLPSISTLKAGQRANSRQSNKRMSSSSQRATPRGAPSNGSFNVPSNSNPQ